MEYTSPHNPNKTPSSPEREPAARPVSAEERLSGLIDRYVNNKSDQMRRDKKEKRQNNN